MEAQDIAIYGGLAYLIYRLTRPAEEPPTPGPGGPTYVPVAPPPAQPVRTVVGAGPAAPPQQTIFVPAPPPAPTYEVVAPPAPAPQSGAPTVPPAPAYEVVAAGAPRISYETIPGITSGVVYDLVQKGSGPAEAVLPTGQVVPYVAPIGSIVGQPANQTLWQVQPSGALFQTYPVPGGGFVTGYANAIAAGYRAPAG